MIGLGLRALVLPAVMYQVSREQKAQIDKDVSISCAVSILLQRAWIPAWEFQRRPGTPVKCPWNYSILNVRTPTIGHEAS